MTTRKQGAATKRPRPSGPTISEVERLSRGQEQLHIRVGAGYKGRLRALAEDAGLSLGEQVESLIAAEERHRGTK